MVIEITPRNVLLILLSIIALLLLANIAMMVSRLYFGYGSLLGLVELFNFNSERNIPTLYSSVALLFASVLLLVITNLRRAADEPFILWALLAAIFLFLSIDETSMIHERFTDPIRDSFGTTGVLYYAWILPYGAALCVFLIAYSKFLVALPRRTATLFVVSGALFILGAIGFEMLGGWWAEQHGEAGLLYAVFYTSEEFFEMLGVAIFIYTLLEYLLSQRANLSIALVKTPSA